jgi:protein-disulfide isomerase
LDRIEVGPTIHFSGISQKEKDNLIIRFSRRLVIFSGAILCVVSVLLFAQTKPASSPARGAAHAGAKSGAAAPSGEKIIQFVRAKYGVADTMSIIFAPYRDSAAPGFLDSTISVDDGQNTKTSKRSSEISVSKDGHYLVMSRVPSTGPGASSFFPLKGAAKEYIGREVHEAFHLPPTMTETVGPPQASPIPNFIKTTVTVDTGKQKSPVETFVTKDHRFVVIGDIFDLSIDPKREAMRTLILQNQPETGARNAPVTIVEFADLECPTCSRAHDFLETTLLPKYQGKVRVVFKEFPLQVHEWAMPAAIANQCAYRIDPSHYLPYRTSIFQHQAGFEAIKTNPSAVRDMLMDFGQQVGIDKVQLEGCYDSKASLPRIEANMKEAAALNVNMTPTFFINGRIMVGLVPGVFTQAVDEAIADAGKKK